ncbi:MAG: hypothetical protein ACI8T1_002716 [Verrucomicrobiales bacterium]|jgi:hypothetical protein
MAGSVPSRAASTKSFRWDSCPAVSVTAALAMLLWTSKSGISIGWPEANLMVDFRRFRGPTRWTPGYAVGDLGSG